MSAGLGRRERSEQGAVAILFAVLAVVLLMSAALAVDITMQVNKKHYLQDTLDAAAQAGAYELPGSTATARTAALQFAEKHDASATGDDAPYVDFWCIVAADGTKPDEAQIPTTCNPAAPPSGIVRGAPYTTARYPGLVCSKILCAIPCVQPTPDNGTPRITCNTIRVTSERDVPFAFAPAGGIEKGSTGAVISVACKGSCGTVAPNPMDVAVIADRSTSMSTTDRNRMVAGIKDMLKKMTPEQQYVALGTIGRAKVENTPTTEPSTSCPSDPAPQNQYTKGTWIPVPFSDNYLKSNRTDLNTNSALVKALNCLDDAPTGTSLAAATKAAARYLLGSSVGASNNLNRLPERELGTVRKVLILETDGAPAEGAPTGGSTSLTNGQDPFYNWKSLTSWVTNQTSHEGTEVTHRDRTVRTCPQPWNCQNKTYKDTFLTKTVNRNMVKSRYIDAGQAACDNLRQVATEAKQRGIIVITIGFNLDGRHCNTDSGNQPSSRTDVDNGDTVITGSSPQNQCLTQSWGGRYSYNQNCSFNAPVTVQQERTRTTTNEVVTDQPADNVQQVLAEIASPVSPGVPSRHDKSCTSVNGQPAPENTDGDFFFCAASGDDMASIFTTALAQVSSGIKLIRMPGS